MNPKTRLAVAIGSVSAVSAAVRCLVSWSRRRDQPQATRRHVLADEADGAVRDVASREAMTDLLNHTSHASAGLDEQRRATILGRLDAAAAPGESMVVADALGRGELDLRRFGRSDVTDGVRWAGTATTSNSELRVLHALLIVHDLLDTARVEDLEQAVRHVTDWQNANPRTEPAHRMAWHDETTARRTMALIRLHDRLSMLERAHSAIPRMTSMLLEHALLLADQGFHATGTNHGMFQDRALLLASAYLELRFGSHIRLRAMRDTARSRLLDYYRSTVSLEGVHLEHAPAYHQLIARATRRDSTMFDDLGEPDVAAELRGVHARMLDYAVHVIQPDGTWPLISDTFDSDQIQISLWDDEYYRFAASAGRRGSPPRVTAAVFPQAGYAIFRDRWSRDGMGTYLHLAAAYHASYHKHADDLSIWLYHDGPLLTEVGPHSYQLKDPRSACAYSELGHNTVTVVGHPLPRVDDRVGATRLVEGDVDGPTFFARARNARIMGSTIERSVGYHPGARHVAIGDRVVSDEPRAARIRWHLDPAISVEALGSSLAFSRGGRTVATMTLGVNVAFEVQLLGPSDEDCSGWRFGGGEPRRTTTVQLTTRPARNIEVEHAIDLR